MGGWGWVSGKHCEVMNEIVCSDRNRDKFVVGCVGDCVGDYVDGVVALAPVGVDHVRVVVAADAVEPVVRAVGVGNTSCSWLKLKTPDLNCEIRLGFAFEFGRLSRRDNATRSRDNRFRIL